MGFSFFKEKRTGSAILVDVGSKSIGGAYVQFLADATPVVSYTARVPIEYPKDEPTTLGMLRAFGALEQELLLKGLPAFRRESGEDKPDRVIVSISALWQQTKIETETIVQDKPFVFTQAMLANALAKQQEGVQGKKLLQKEVVAILMNGYETTAPVGKQAKRADIVMLSSVMDPETMTLLGKAAKRLNPRYGVLLAPFQSLVYAVLRKEFPHDKDFLMMRVSEEATSALLANRGLLMDAVSMPIGLDLLPHPLRQGMKTLHVNGAEEKDTVSAPLETKTGPSKETETAWVTGVTELFKEFATRHALPRILFLVSHEGTTDYLKKLLDTPELHGLWLSDEPLTVIPVVSRLLSSLIQHHGQSEPDVMLDLIVLFAALRLEEKA